MKTSIFTLLIIAVFSVAVSAQTDKRVFKVEKYAVGEDASSGMDYIIYKYKGRIARIREIWSSSANRNPTAEEFQYDAKGNTVAYYEFAIKYSQVNAVVRNSKYVLKATDVRILKDGKMVKWTENGKIISNSDPRWAEMESDALTRGKNMLEFYPEMKEM